MSAIETLRHKVKYPRPTKLSDPYQDFTPDHLTAILAKSDTELTWVEYRNLLGPYLPAGTYEEVIYFLPLAFAFFVRPENERGGHEMVSSIVGFISRNVENLQKDDLLEAARDCIRECFDIWTHPFTVVDYDLTALWPAYRRGVEHVELISVTIEELIDFKSHVDLAHEFVQALAKKESDPLKAAWFLAYASHENEQKKIHTTYLSDETIQSFISDLNLLKKAEELVRGNLPLWNASPIYWNDTFDALGLDDIV